MHNLLQSFEVSNHHLFVISSAKNRNNFQFSSLLIYSLGPDSSLYPLSVLRACATSFDMPSLDMLCKRQRGRLTVKLTGAPNDRVRHLSTLKKLLSADILLSILSTCYDDNFDNPKAERPFNCKIENGKCSDF